MRNTAFLVMGLLLLVVQANLYRLLGHIPVVGASPSLILPLIIFMGVHEYSLSRGAALSFVFGYLLDVMSGAPIGLFTFCSVAVFILARAAGVRLTAQTLFSQAALALGFSLVESGIVLALSVIFRDAKAANSVQALLHLVVPHGIATAIAAPFVFRLAERVHFITLRAARHDREALR